MLALPNCGLISWSTACTVISGDPASTSSFKLISNRPSWVFVLTKTGVQSLISLAMIRTGTALCRCPSDASSTASSYINCSSTLVFHVWIVWNHLQSNITLGGVFIIQKVGEDVEYEAAGLTTFATRRRQLQILFHVVIGGDNAQCVRPVFFLSNVS